MPTSRSGQAQPWLKIPRTPTTAAVLGSSNRRTGSCSRRRQQQRLLRGNANPAIPSQPEGPSPSSLPVCDLPAGVEGGVQLRPGHRPSTVPKPIIVIMVQLTLSVYCGPSPGHNFDPHPGGGKVPLILTRDQKLPQEGELWDWGLDPGPHTLSTQSAASTLLQATSRPYNCRASSPPHPSAAQAFLPIP